VASPLLKFSPAPFPTLNFHFFPPSFPYE
jgi:hypothetical protein